MVRALVGDSTITSFLSVDLLNRSPQTGSVKVRQGSRAVKPVPGLSAYLSRNGANYTESNAIVKQQASRGSEGAAVSDGSAERDFIGIFQVSAHRQAVGNTGCGNVGVLQQAGHIHRSCLALDSG